VIGLKIVTILPHRRVYDAYWEGGQKSSLKSEKEAAKRYEP